MCPVFFFVTKILSPPIFLVTTCIPLDLIRCLSISTPTRDSIKFAQGPAALMTALVLYTISFPEILSFAMIVYRELFERVIETTSV